MLQVLLTQDFGKIKPPPGLDKFPPGTAGLVKFISNSVRLLIIIASIYVLFNIIFAGYQFISAGGDPKKAEEARSKITQSLFGLFLIAGSFVLAAIFGLLVFGDAGFILNPNFNTLAPTQPNPGYVPDRPESMLIIPFNSNLIAQLP